MLGPWGPYLFRGEPEQQEVKVFSREEAREAGEEAGPGHLKSPSSLSGVGCQYSGIYFGGVGLWQAVSQGEKSPGYPLQGHLLAPVTITSKILEP